MTEAFRVARSSSPRGGAAASAAERGVPRAARAGMAEASLAKVTSRARETGVLSLANRALEAVPAPVFALEDHASEDERFWSTSTSRSSTSRTTCSPSSTRTRTLCGATRRSTRCSRATTGSRGCRPRSSAARR